MNKHYFYPSLTLQSTNYQLEHIIEVRRTVWKPLPPCLRKSSNNFHSHSSSGLGAVRTRRARNKPFSRNWKLPASFTKRWQSIEIQKETYWNSIVKFATEKDPLEKRPNSKVLTVGQFRSSLSRRRADPDFPRFSPSGRRVSTAFQDDGQLEVGARVQRGVRRRQVAAERFFRGAQQRHGVLRGGEGVRARRFPDLEDYRWVVWNFGSRGWFECG